MGQYNSTGEITQTPDGAIPLYSRVMKTATGVDVAGASDPTFGSALRAGYAATDDGQADISVKLRSAPGTHYAIAAGAITEGDEIEGGALGTVDVLGAGDVIGIALQTAVEDQVIEVMYY